MTDYLNNYASPDINIPRDIHLNTPRGEYDHNFVFPVRQLQSDRVELRPFIPSEHAQLLFEGLRNYPETCKWLSINPPRDIGDVLIMVEKIFRRNSNCMFYAIFTAPPSSPPTTTPPSEYTFAGALALLEASSVHLSIEPGFIMILPPFQRTHVLTHTAGLILHYALDRPSEGGLGLRRCQWTTTTLNLASQKAALRLGFKQEGVLRAMWVLPPGKQGARGGRKGVKFEDGESRDNWFASIIWTEWEESVKDHIDTLMARQS